MSSLKKRGVNATPEGTQKRIANLRRTRSTHNNTKEFAQMRNPDRPLTEKQVLTVKYWSEGDTLRNALIRAGYNESSTPTLTMTYRNDPAILKAYHAAVEKVEKAADFSRKKFMDGLQDAADLAKLLAEPSTMVAAYREMGKACGYYEPQKVSIDVNVKGNVLLQRLNSMSDEELLRIAGEAIEGQFEVVQDEEEIGKVGKTGRKALAAPAP